MSQKKAPILIATSFLFLALLLMFSPSPKAGAFSGNSPCSATLNPYGSQGNGWVCGTYSVIDLKPYLNSDSPSGSSLDVGYCVPNPSGCTYYALLITPGHYGSEFIASQDTSVYSFYGNPNSFQVSFSGTDYWTFN
jgi:hypothetical protein